MARITDITARQILDSRGWPTVEATVTLDSGVSHFSSVPTGVATNKLEAAELRDHDNTAYFGQGVSKAVANVNTVIKDKLVGMDPLYQTQIDQALVDLDGTTNKSRLGANALMAVSQAVVKAAAASLNLPLFMYFKEKYQLVDAYRMPTPIFNLINGGRHGSGALDFQEFQLVPASHLPYSQALRIGAEVFMALDKTLEQKGAIRTVGMEGGYAPNLATNIDALEVFAEAIRLTPYQLAQDAFLGLDVSPRWFYKSGKYTIKDRPQPLNGKALVKFYQDLHHQYRVFSFEDPLLADDWDDWQFMTAELGETAMIVADDLVSTNKTLLMKAIQAKACNAVVIKPNRAGTVTETIEVISIAKKAGWHIIMSHRSGETNDTLWADAAVGVGTDYVKFGATSRGERVVKYNRLLRIEETLLRSSQRTEPTIGEPFMEPSNNPAGVTSAMPVAPTEPAMPMDTSSAVMSAMPSAAMPSATPAVTMPDYEPTTPAPPVEPLPAAVMPAAPTPAPEATPFASVFSSIGTAAPAPAPLTSSFTQPAAPVTAAPVVAPSVSTVTPLVPTPVSVEASMPASPAMVLNQPSTAPTIPTENTSMVTPVPVAPVAALAPNSDTATELQDNLNELAKMVGNVPAAPMAAPALATPTIPTVAAPAQPAASFPAGLTPPTPPLGN